jgi:hypothetical protein
MGYARATALMVAAIALAGTGRNVAAAPAEPLIVANLQEPVLQVVVMRDPEADAVGEETRRFAQALDNAALVQRQAAAQRCRTIQEIPSAGSDREAWEANCRYTRL